MSTSLIFPDNDTTAVYSQYIAAVLTVHRRCTHGTPPLYSLYITAVLKVHRPCTGYAPKNPDEMAEKWENSSHARTRAYI